MIRYCSHIGVAVKNLDDALHFYTTVLGLEEIPDTRTDFPEFGFRNAFVRIGDNLFIELMEGGPDTELGKFLEKRGEGLYHLCWAVDDLDADMEELKARGADVIEIPESPSVPGKRGFLRRRCMHGVLVELVSKEGLDRWVARGGTEKPGIQT